MKRYVSFVLVSAAAFNFLQQSTDGFTPIIPVQRCPQSQRAYSVLLHDMKRPLLDKIASTLFGLENARVKASSEVDEKGRTGEPMAWSEKNSLANQFSEIMATFGYEFKQFVADVVAGDFDEAEVEAIVDKFVSENAVAMFSFTTCPFCRRAKDFLETNNIPYNTMELDTDVRGNEIRAVLGRKTRRTSMPSIFIHGDFIGGCNDGPGLLPLAESGDLEKLLQDPSLSQ